MVPDRSWSKSCEKASDSCVQTLKPSLQIVVEAFFCGYTSVPSGDRGFPVGYTPVPSGDRSVIVKKRLVP